MESQAHKCLRLLYEVLDALKEAKPSERSEYARRIAICVTEQEKVLAYFATYVYGEETSSEKDIASLKAPQE